MATSPDGWSAPDAGGIATRMLDVGAKSTLRGRRMRRCWQLQLDVIELWPAAWRALLVRWLDGGASRRWDTLLKAAGHVQYNDAHDLLWALLSAGCIEVEEKRERAQWRPATVHFVEAARLRVGLGIADREELRAELERELAVPPLDSRLLPLWEELADHPAARALERSVLLRKLDIWIAELRFGTRRDFALFARGTTKAITGAEWNWLERGVDLVELGIERHTPALWLRAPLTLHTDTGSLNLGAVPDAIGITPATIARATAIEGTVGCWRVIENRTSFERAARECGSADAVVWLPGYPPSWWRDSMARLLRLHAIPALVACDPDPAGIEIAVAAGKLWAELGLQWSPWKMDVATLASLRSRTGLQAGDRAILARLRECPLPAELRTLAAWMLEHGEKGEQEGAL